MNIIILERLHGHANDVKTQGLISATFSFIWSLGALLGPVAGGIVVDTIGFDMASFCLVGFFLFIVSFLFFNNYLILIVFIFDI